MSRRFDALSGQGGAWRGLATPVGCDSDGGSEKPSGKESDDGKVRPRGVKK
jgi:hypothetical protein